MVARGPPCGPRWAARLPASSGTDIACPNCQAAIPPGGRFCAQCGAPLPAEDAAPRTSRRQMTVLFCDLVGSTELAQRIDADDLVDALQRYHDTVRLIGARFGGFVARIV